MIKVRKVLLLTGALICTMSMTGCSSSKDNHDNNKTTKESTTLQEESSTIPEDSVAKGDIKIISDYNTSKEVIWCTAEDIKYAEAVTQTSIYTGSNESVVKIYFNETGTSKFANATTENIHKVLTITCNDEVVSSPKVDSVITDGCAIISNLDSMDKAAELAASIMGTN